MKDTFSFPTNLIWCIIEDDGYGIGNVRGTKVYASKGAAEDDIPEGDELAIAVLLSEALNMIQDAYWIERHKGRDLPIGFFKSEYYNNLHKENHIIGIGIKPE